MGIRALPDEKAPDDPAVRFARGVWDGDFLPEVECAGERSAPLSLSLQPMDMGEDESGLPSWTARTQRLLKEHGPFRLAYLEALLRMADWRASEQERKAGGGDGG
jgi:CRISPR-associated endonuclease/helicase Cas3